MSYDYDLVAHLDLTRGGMNWPHPYAMTYATRDRRIMAYWYYKGRADQADQGAAHQGEQWHFALFAGSEAEAYEQGEITHLEGIQRQYERYVTKDKTGL